MLSKTTFLAFILSFSTLAAQVAAIPTASSLDAVHRSRFRYGRSPLHHSSHLRKRCIVDAKQFLLTTALSQTSSTPTQMSDTPTQTSSTPTQTSSTPTQTSITSTQTSTTPTQTSSTPTQTSDTSTQTSSTPTQTSSTPTQTSSTPTQTSSTPTQTCTPSSQSFTGYLGVKMVSNNNIVGHVWKSPPAGQYAMISSTLISDRLSISLIGASNVASSHLNIQMTPSFGGKYPYFGIAPYGNTFQVVATKETLPGTPPSPVGHSAGSATATSESAIWKFDPCSNEVTYDWVDSYSNVLTGYMFLGGTMGNTRLLIPRLNNAVMAGYDEVKFVFIPA